MAQVENDNAEDLRWYALRVLPQREDMVKKVLRYHGIQAFVKTERRLRRKTKLDKIRSERLFVAAAGYVFVGTEGNPWSFMRSCHLIRSVVSVNGRPARLDPELLADFLGFDTYDESTPTYFREFKTKGPTFEIGEVVTIEAPGFDGFRLPIKDIARGEAVFDLVWNSAIPTEIRVPLDHLIKAA